MLVIQTCDDVLRTHERSDLGNTVSFAEGNEHIVGVHPFKRGMYSYTMTMTRQWQWQ